jgi:hypothetical protein
MRWRIGMVDSYHISLNVKMRKLANYLQKMIMPAWDSLFFFEKEESFNESKMSCQTRSDAYVAVIKQLLMLVILHGKRTAQIQNQEQYILAGQTRTRPREIFVRAFYAKKLAVF